MLRPRRLPMFLDNAPRLQHHLLFCNDLQGVLKDSFQGKLSLLERRK